MAISDDTLYLAALSAIPEVGPITIGRLIRRFGGPGQVFAAGGHDIAQVEGMSQKKVEAIKAYKGFESLRADIEKLQSEGINIVTTGSEGYPEAFESIGEDAPLILYVKGKIESDDACAVAMVGSRKSSAYGISVANRFARDLASMGICIISGMARGIDTTAHRGAIVAGGRTIAVMGSGIDVPYPPENMKLMEEIAAHGAVITEFPPGMQPLPANFPRRNRIISALSLGVLVVEAAQRSGALITARFALEQGREVFAVPGNISSETSAGTNDLIRQGARMVMKAEDIIAELAPKIKIHLKSRAQPIMPVLATEEGSFYDILSFEPTHIDDLARRAGTPVGKALSILMGLELKGLVKQAEGKIFYKA